MRFKKKEFSHLFFATLVSSLLVVGIFIYYAIILDNGYLMSDLGGEGLFGVEFFIVDNEVIFSELSPRPHDTGLVTIISQELNEFELTFLFILSKILLPLYSILIKCKPKTPIINGEK